MFKILNDGLRTPSDMPSPWASPPTNVVFPVPRSPTRAMDELWGNNLAKFMAKFRVSFSVLQIISMSNSCDMAIPK